MASSSVSKDFADIDISTAFMNLDENPSDNDTDLKKKTLHGNQGPTFGRAPLEPSSFTNDRRKDEFQKFVTHQFSSADNPYECVFSLIEKWTNDFSTMSVVIMKEFSIWLRAEEREKKIRPLLTFDIQMRAFSLATKPRSATLLKIAFDVFRLVDVAEKFVDDVRIIAQNGSFRKAAECAIALGIQRYFGLNEVYVSFYDRPNF